MAATNKTAEGSKAHERKRVVVIGSGISGISAARHLQRHGGFDVVVLEGRQDRYGGRIRTDTKSFTNNAAVDLGASFIHGSCQKHPITKLRDQFEIETVTADYFYQSKTFDGETGAPIGSTKLLYNFAKFAYNERKVRQAGQRLHQDTSIKEVVEETGLMPSMTTPIGIMFRLASWDYAFASNYDQVSAKLMDTRDSISGSEEIFPDGYKQILSRLVDGDEKRPPLKIIYNAIVSRVSYSDDDDSVLVMTDDGTEYAADCVLITASLGVLKAGDIAFDPPLDSEREAAIKRVGFGTVNKIVLEFDKPFWSDTHSFDMTPKSDSPKDVMMVFWINMMTLAGKPIIMSFLGGEAGLLSETMSEDELKELALSRLKTVFGEESVNNSKLVSMVRTKWKEDPFSKGSYSFPAVGQKADDFHTLGKPIGRLVHFAGEHTSLKFWGTVHGAYNSGLRAANEIIGNYFPADRSSSSEEEKGENSHSGFSCTIS